MTDSLPVWRSLLYVPAHVDRFVARAHERGADCIQIDLEDSVPASAKDAARASVPRNAALVRRGGADVLVRINRPLSLAVRDIESSVGPDVDGFVLPKVGSADQVRLIEEHIAEVELRRGLVVGHSRLVVLIEMSYRLATQPELGTRMRLLGIPVDASTAASWTGALAAVILGFVAFRATWPTVAAAFERVQAASPSRSRLPPS